MDSKVSNTITDLVSDFLYYDRQEDEDLSVGDIESRIANGDLSISEIVSKFEEELRKQIAL